MVSSHRVGINGNEKSSSWGLERRGASVGELGLYS